MTATEKLRTMLDERGVEWTNPNSSLRDEMTSWVANGFDYDAFEVPDGTLVLTAAHQDDLTPEQAIAATLGAGTCKDVCSGVSEFTCSACGFECDLTSWISLFDGDDGRHRHHHHGTPHYCPNCGRKVVDE